MKNQKYFNSSDKLRLKALIQEKTGCVISKDGLLSQAFRRRSYCAEGGGKSNELLEFIGDQVINYYVVKKIAERCGAFNAEFDYAFRIRENRFSTIKQELTSNELFAQIIDEWGVADDLIVGVCDEQNRVVLEPKVKADLFEAIVGALAVSYQWNTAVLESAVNKALSLDKRLDSMVRSDCGVVNLTMDNAITMLKEMAEKEMCSMPEYKFSGPENLGYDKEGKTVWECLCSVKDMGLIRSVRASNKSDAKKAATYAVLREHFQLPNLYGPSIFYPGWIYKDGELLPDRSEKK